MLAAFPYGRQAGLPAQASNTPARLPGFPVTFCAGARPSRRRLRGGLTPLFPVRLQNATPDVLVIIIISL